MRNLAEFLARYYHWLLFIILEAAGIALLLSYNSYQSSVFFSTANTVSGKCLEWSSKVTSYFGLKEANRQLTLRNTQLEQQLNSARATIERMSTDPSKARVEVPEQYTTISARVVQNSINKADNLMTIDKGSADGVKKDMGVVSGEGVVGITYLVGSHYSVVMPLLNSKSSLSCSIRNRGYFGYLHWQGPDSRYAYVEDVPRHAHYTRGDIIETSGYSSVFPKGITVGKVICTFNSADGLSYRIKIKLATDFSNLSDVCVISSPDMLERNGLLQAASDSIAGKRD
jgi:rod shape-determining protein MreC